MNLTFCRSTKRSARSSTVIRQVFKAQRNVPDAAPPPVPYATCMRLAKSRPEVAGGSGLLPAR